MNWYHYCTKSSLALSIWVLFISLMKPVNGAQFLVTIFLLLFGTAAACVLGTVMIPLVSSFASLSSCKHYYHQRLTK